MALGDIKWLQGAPSSGDTSVKLCNVAASATTIKAGEPVTRAAGAVAVIPMVTNKPVAQNAGTFADPTFVGVAMDTSTNTASAAGTVHVAVYKPGQIYLVKPNSSAAWDTRAEYDALVGKRVLMDLTSSSYTILATDSATNGLVIEALNIAEHPGVVAFSVRNSCLGD